MPNYSELTRKIDDKIASAPTTQPRLGIAIELTELRGLMDTFIKEQISLDSEDAPHEYRWRFESFLQWLRRRQEASNGDVRPTS